MEDNELDKILRDKLKNKIVPSQEFENKIKSKIEEQKKIEKNKKAKKRFPKIVTLIPVAAAAVVVFSFGLKLNENVDEIFKGDTSIAAIKAIEPTKLESGIIANDSEFIIKADEDSTKESIQGSLYIEPALDYTIEETENDNEYKLTFKQNIPDNTVLKLQYVKDQITQDSWAYQTSSKLSVTDVYPGYYDSSSYVSQDTVIEVEFSYANVENFLENVSIDPGVEGEWEHFGKIWRFTPDSSLEKGTYKVTISSGVTAGEETLEDDYSFKFTVADELEDISIQYLSNSIDRISTYKNDENVKIYYMNDYQEDTVPDIETVEIGKFENTDDFIKYLENSSNKENASNTQNYEFTLNTTDCYVELNNSLGSGYYVAILKDSNGKEIFDCPIQINSLSAYAIETERDVLVWVADEDGLAKNVKVEYADKEEKTDSDGIAKFEDIADGSETIKYAKVGNDENKLVIGFYNYKFDNYPTAYLYTDKLLYKSTDTIKIWGYVPMTMFYGDVEDEFYIELDGEGKQKVEVSSDGNLNYEINLQNHFDTDTAVTLYYKDEAIAYRSISIENYELQNYTYEIIADKNYAYENTNYEFDVKVTHITGILVPNKVLCINFGEETYFETTGEDGIAHFSVYIESDEEINYSGVYSKTISVYNGDLEEYNTSETEMDIYILSSNVEIDVNEKSENKYQINLYKLFEDKDINIVGYELDNLRDSNYDTEVYVGVIETVYEKNVTDYIYNEYTKEYEEEYEWNSYEDSILLDTIDTENGEAEFDASNIEYKTDTDTTIYSYRIEFSVEDTNGNNATSSVYVSDNSSAYNNFEFGYFYMESFYSDDEFAVLEEKQIGIDYRYYYTYRYFLENEITREDGYSIGDKETYSLCESQVGKIENEGKILTVVFQENISRTEITDENDFTYTFSEEDFPGCKLASAYYYNGKFYRMPTYYLDADEEDREIDIEITQDKESYEPGDEVELTIKTTNNGKAIKSFVNVSVVNEAVFEIEEDETNILEAIYTDKTYPVYTYSSYADVLNGGDLGGGGEGIPRGNFADTAHFETVYTNNKGEATVKFTLPDNVTTYRVTAQAANEDMYVGMNTIDITSKLDFFVQVTEPRNVKNVDDLVLNATSIADEDYDVDYEFTIKELDETLTATGTTNNLVTVNFGKLECGTYHAIIKAEANGNEDSIEYEFEIVGSSQEVEAKEELKISETATISPTRNPICLEIYNENMKTYLNYIEFISQTQNERLDTQIAYNKIIEYKNQYYQTEETIGTIDNIIEYVDSSLIKNLPNSQGDLLLTALVSYYARDYYNSMYIYNSIKDLVKDDMNLFEVYLLAASQNEPVLSDLLYLKEEQDIDNYNKLLVTLSLEFLGDYQNAKELYESIDLNDEEDVEYRSIVAIIETFIDKENAVSIIDEMIENKPADEYLRFAILSFFQNSSETLDEEETVKITCGDKEETITLKGMQVQKYWISNEDLNDISFETTSQDLMVSYYYQTLLENTEYDVNSSIEIYGDLSKGNTVTLEISGLQEEASDIRITLPNSLRLSLSQGDFEEEYYLKSNNIDYIVIHKNKDVDTIQIPLLVVYEGNYKFESVVIQDNDGEYSISNSLDLTIE